MVSRWCGWAALYTALVQLVPAFGMSWTVVNEDADTDGNPTNVGDYAMVTTKDRNRIWFYDGSGQTDTEIFYMDVSGASGFAWVKLAVDNTNGPGDQWSLSAAMDSNNVIWLYGGNAGSQDVHTIDVSAATASTTTLAVVLRSANNRPTAPGYGNAVAMDSTDGLWSFGGNSNSGGEFYYLKTTDSTLSWVTKSTTGDTISHRKHHSAVMDPNNIMWIYSGEGFSGQLYSFNTIAGDDGTHQVTSRTSSGQTLSGRHAAAMSAAGIMYVTGGSSCSSPCSTVYSYDTSTFAWTSNDVAIPDGQDSRALLRQEHKGVVDANTRFWFIGGYHGYYSWGRMSDLWYLDDSPSTTTTTSTFSSTSSVSSTSSSSSSSISRSSTSTVTATSSITTSSSVTFSSTSTSSLTSSSSMSTTSTVSSTVSSSTSSSTSTSTSSSRSSSSTSSSTSKTSSSTRSSTTSASRSSTSTSSTSSSSTSTKSTTSTSSFTSTTTSTSSCTVTGSTTSTSTSTSSSTSSTETHSTSTSSSVTQTHSSSSTATQSTLTSSSTSTSITSVTATRTQQVISAQELEVLEEERKEEAKQAVAAVEVAETAAVLEAVNLLFSKSNSSEKSPPGVLGQVVMKTETGPVKIAALSVEALANADKPAKVSAGKDSTAEVEVDAGLLGEVAAAAGSGQVLLSLAELDEQASASFRTDNVLAQEGRRLASALRSRPLSINFRKTDGQKIAVKNLAQPMRMKLAVDDPEASCAYWDEEAAQWSTEGVETLPGEERGTVVCSTTHLSIFGAIIKVALRNVKVALRCSTFSSLMDAAAFRNLMKPEWLQRLATIVTIVFLIVFLLALHLARRADKKSERQLPWSEREMMLFRLKEVETPEEPSEQAEVDHKDEDSNANADEEKEGDDGKKGKERKEKNTENAAAGDWELPSIFRTIRGLVEGLLDMLSQATGGESFVDGLKELVSNADTGTINRSIGMLQSHRTGADQATLQIMTDGGVDAVRTEKSKSMSLHDADADGVSRRDVHEGGEEHQLEVESLHDADADGVSRRDMHEGGEEHQLEVESSHGEEGEDLKSRDDSAEEDIVEDVEVEPVEPTVQPTRRGLRASVGRMGAAARRLRTTIHGAVIDKVQLLHGQASGHGADQATRFLDSGYLCRVLMLFPAAHTWFKLAQLSILVPVAVRVALVGMKVIGAQALNSLFFSSTAPTPDSDPECSPPKEPFARFMQSATVGIVTAFLTDGIIFLLFLVQRKSVLARKDWTEKSKGRQRKWWFCRTFAFWFLTVAYVITCELYTFLFLSNVREVDAQQWLESTLVSLLQDLLLKPLLFAVILATLSSLLLCCRPSIRKRIEAKWVDEEIDDSKDSKEVMLQSHDDDSSSAGDAVEEEKPRRKPSTGDFMPVLPGEIQHVPA